MIKAVLLDLDNTLLRNPDTMFAVEYLNRIDRYFQERWQFQGMSRLLIHTMQALLSQRDMQRTNFQVSIDVIRQHVGRSGDEIERVFADFYASIYPELSHCVEPIPIAAQLVRYLRDQQYAVVIATNPIYPLSAILQRLAWSGLPDHENDYAFVTHSENMHSIKPDPAYYAEILARVGIEPDEAIMIGDSLKNDIKPAMAIGMHTYHTVPGEKPADGEHANALEDFYRAVSNPDWPESLPANSLTPGMIEPQLRGNVGALFGLLDGIKEHYWMQHPDPNEWSILQIICHLLESEDTVQRPRLQRILDENNPFLAVPKSPPGPNSAPCDSDGRHIAQRFARSRQETIGFLQELSETDWKRPARHSIFGPTNLLEMALFTAQHDRLHLNQLCQTLGNCQ